MKNKRGVVFTTITVGKNKLLPFKRNPEWDYVCFTDNMHMTNPYRWKLVYLHCENIPTRRCSKLPKILAHKHVKDYEYSIYLDGCVQIKSDPEQLVKTLDGRDFALFKHYSRNCIYKEAGVVKSAKRDFPKLVDAAIKKYKKEGYPPNNGLCDTKVIVRHHTEKAKKFNELWWEVYQEYSQRDQLSFNYVAWKLGVEYSILEGNPYKPNKYIKKHKHQKSGKETDNVEPNKQIKKRNMKTIEIEYNKKCKTKSDINEHLPTLKQYAEECEHITELGCRGVVSTWAFLAGSPKKMVSIDIEDCKVDAASNACKQANIDFKFVKADDTKIEIEPTDLLFIDTLHTYDHLSKELSMHGKKAKKYIILHDTEIFGHKDYYGNKKYGTEGVVGLQPAIDEFLKKNRSWKIEKVFKNNNGLTVLKKQPRKPRKKKTEE